MAMERRKRSASETSSNSTLELDELPKRVKTTENNTNLQIAQVLNYLQTESELDKSTRQFFSNQEKEWELRHDRDQAELKLKEEELQIRKNEMELAKRKLDLEEKKIKADIEERNNSNKLMMQMMSKFIKDN